jgi:hypothetical protein
MAGNRFEVLMDMSEDVTDTPRTKRTINDRSPEAADDDRATKLKKLNLMEVCRKAEKDMDSLKDELAMANTKMDEKTTWKDAKVIFMTLFDSVVDSIESNVTVMTDVTAAVDRYENVIAEKDRKIEKLVERIGELEARKDSQEAKASQAEMAGEIRQAMATFKVLDLDIGKETEDRKEIIDGAAKDMNSKIRSDVREKWTEATRTAKVIPVGRKTGKRTVDGKEINTVPVLIRIEDKDNRWKAEEALRQSKIHPAFHWPQGMLGHVKKFRQDMVEAGATEADYYIRIRPEDRSGKLRIRGDIKPKSGGRFEPKMYWNVPAFDNDINKKYPDILKPQMVSGSGSAAGSGGGAERENRNKSRASYRPPPTPTVRNTNDDNIFAEGTGN